VKNTKKKPDPKGPYYAVSMPNPKCAQFPYGVVNISGERRMVALFEDQYPAWEYVRFMNEKFRSALPTSGPPRTRTS